MKSKIEWIKENYPKKHFTKEQAKDLCVEMWNEMAENRYIEKCSSKLINIFKPQLDCFACAYYKSSCSDCEFSILFGSCTHRSSPYDKWYIEKRNTKEVSENLKKYAIEIADLFID